MQRPLRVRLRVVHEGAGGTRVAMAPLAQLVTVVIRGCGRVWLRCGQCVRAAIHALRQVVLGVADQIRQAALEVFEGRRQPTAAAAARCGGGGARPAERVQNDERVSVRIRDNAASVDVALLLLLALRSIVERRRPFPTRRGCDGSTGAGPFALTGRVRGGPDVCSRARLAVPSLVCPHLFPFVSMFLFNRSLQREWTAEEGRGPRLAVLRWPALRAVGRKNRSRKVGGLGDSGHSGARGDQARVDQQEEQEEEKEEGGREGGSTRGSGSGDEWARPRRTTVNGDRRGDRHARCRLFPSSAQRQQLPLTLLASPCAPIPARPSPV